ncbi:MAG: hypothetical protein V3U46_08400 [Acidimicrobiia bacterium]
MKTMTSTPVDQPMTQLTPEEIFADPVSYLRPLGIEAVLVIEPETFRKAA